MDKIFELYEETLNENFIGHDKAALDIIELASMILYKYLNNHYIESFDKVEYDQVKRTKYYEILRWAVSHLASNFKSQG